MPSIFGKCIVSKLGTRIRNTSRTTQWQKRTSDTLCPHIVLPPSSFRHKAVESRRRPFRETTIPRFLRSLAIRRSRQANPSRSQFRHRMRTPDPFRNARPPDQTEATGIFGVDKTHVSSGLWQIQTNHFCLPSISRIFCFV